MIELWNHKERQEGPSYQVLRDECIHWIKLLLSVVRVTKKNAHLHLQKFLAPEEGSIINDKKCQKYIMSYIMKKTKKNFPKLSIQMFFALYKSFKIWPITVSLNYHSPICSSMHCPFYLFSTITHSSIYLFLTIIHSSIYIFQSNIHSSIYVFQYIIHSPSMYSMHCPFYLFSTITHLSIYLFSTIFHLHLSISAHYPLIHQPIIHSSS